MTCIDLFCGAGGLSDGLAQAGFRSVAGVDLDPHAISSYAANHTDALALQRDIETVTADELSDALGGRDLDLIAGGPSCQGFSTIGKRIEDDPRNVLFRHFARLVRELRPKFFLMENVKGLLTYRKGYFRQVISESFREAGYEVVARVVCAADYGVPQLRNRIVFIGTRLDVPLSFPEPTHGPPGTLLGLKPYVTVGEAIGDLPLMNGVFNQSRWEYASPPKSGFQRYARAGSRSKYVTLHRANGLSDAAREVVKLVKEGQGLRSVPVDLLPARFKRMRRISTGELRKDCTTLYHRIARNAPAYTITCYFRNVASGPFVHPIEDRSLSYREAARLMSFRDSYDFHGSMLTRQIGNAVPPLLAKALGTHIRQLLKHASRTGVPDYETVGAT
ncbi:MAG: DNA cytosine methyltransferase [Planctomycetaceae bacterium]|nr:DNA cytosine methyltransferase [Planctomycetaceae bacterium]